MASLKQEGIDQQQTCASYPLLSNTVHAQMQGTYSKEAGQGALSGQLSGTRSALQERTDGRHQRCQVDVQCMRIQHC